MGIGEDDGLGFDDAAPAEDGGSCCAEEEAEEGDGVGETGAGLGSGQPGFVAFGNRRGEACGGEWWFGLCELEDRCVWRRLNKLGIVRGGRPQGRGGTRGRGEKGRAEGVHGCVAGDCTGLGHVGGGTVSIEGTRGGRAREGVGGSHEWRMGLSEVYQGAGMAERVVHGRTGVGGFAVMHCRVQRGTTRREGVGISWVGLEGKGE